MLVFSRRIDVWFGKSSGYINVGITCRLSPESSVKCCFWSAYVLSDSFGVLLIAVEGLIVFFF